MKFSISNFTTKELSHPETTKLLVNKRFDKLKPASCNICKEKSDFSRRLFELSGIPKNMFQEDSFQLAARMYLKKHFSIEKVFFKTLNGKLFADTAVCPACKSTAITYDLDIFDNELILQTAILTGKSEEEIIKDLKIVMDVLNQKDRNL